MGRRNIVCFALSLALFTSPAFAQAVKNRDTAAVMNDTTQIIPDSADMSDYSKPAAGNRYAVAGRYSSAVEEMPDAAYRGREPSSHRAQYTAPPSSSSVDFDDAYIPAAPAPMTTMRMSEPPLAEKKSPEPAYAAPARAIEEPVEQADAEEEGDAPFLDWSAYTSFATDYVSRGYSQTDENPAVQGYIDATHESGLYASLWASNVDFDDGDQAHTEVDATIGWDFEPWDAGTISTGGTYIFYPGARNELDYNYYEFFGGYTHSFLDETFEISGLGYYSPEYFGHTGDAEYAVGTASYYLSVMEDSLFTLTGTGGYQWIQDNDLAATPDYWHWSFGLLHTWKDKITLGVTYHDTDVDAIDCAELCNDRIVVNLDYSM